MGAVPEHFLRSIGFRAARGTGTTRLAVARGALSARRRCRSRSWEGIFPPPTGRSSRSRSAAARRGSRSFGRGRAREISSISPAPAARPRDWCSSARAPKETRLLPASPMRTPAELVAAFPRSRAAPGARAGARMAASRARRDRRVGRARPRRRSAGRRLGPARRARGRPAAGVSRARRLRAGVGEGSDRDDPLGRRRLRSPLRRGARERRSDPGRGPGRRTAAVRGAAPRKGTARSSAPAAGDRDVGALGWDHFGGAGE